MGEPIKSLTIKGFKSIRELDDLELGALNVLIGANGAGKSNFIDFFRMLRAMASENLTGFVNRQGASGLFYLGAKYTPRIKANLKFGDNEFEFVLEPTVNEGVLVAEEGFGLVSESSSNWSRVSIGEKESRLKKNLDPRYFGPNPRIALSIYESVSSWTVYHFHDTSDLAPMRREQSARDTDYLRQDASNIASYLNHLRLKHPTIYERIRDSIRLIAPFFDDFRLRVDQRGTDDFIRLEWNQKGGDFPFQASQLSDGTLRFICLTTALLQPNPPATILIDEPELGLHPHALEILAGLIKKAATMTQVIVSTQSATLLSLFDAEDVIVVSNKDGASEFRRLSEAELAVWLEDYTLGELWQKNYVEGASYG